MGYYDPIFQAIIRFNWTWSELRSLRFQSRMLDYTMKDGA